MKMEIPLLPYQKQFLQTKVKFAWMKCGIGSGKSYTLALYIVNRMLTNPETMGIICANSYKQLKNSILAHVFSRLDSLGLSYNYNVLTAELRLNCNGAKALCMSLENYDQLRGPEFGWIAGDEVAFARHEAYKVLIGRLRCARSKALEGRFTSSPNGTNFMYDTYAEGGYVSRRETPVYQKSKYHIMFSASALENFFLPKDYLASLAEDYSPLEYIQEIEGEFVNLTSGRVYSSFQHESGIRKFDDIVIDRRAGCDFNVNPLTSVIGSVVGDKFVHIYDEIWLEHSNTFELADELASRQPDMTVYPDATGAARKTSAAKTDHQILRDVGLTIKTRRKNPSVKDRYNNVNRWLNNGWLKIDPSCKRLITDLDKLTHENTDDMLSHISDSLGYLLWGINPLKRHTPPSRMHQ